MCDRPVRGEEFSALYVVDGSAAPVRGVRLQSFSRDPLAVDGGHLRTTAVAVAGLLGGVMEGQVPG